MIVVSNASPLLALAQADCLSILKTLFARVLIPTAVYRETVDQCPVPAQKRRIQSAIDDFIAVAVPKIVRSFSRNRAGVLAKRIGRFFGACGSRLISKILRDCAASREDLQALL